MSEYILGTKNDELNRLKLQHELWREECFKIWKRAGFTSGQSILELGCGPGYTTRDLAGYLGPQGAITAADLSEDFIDYLNRQPPQPFQAPIEAIQAPIEQLNLSKKNFVGAYCRWLMIFVPNPGIAIDRIREHLIPGSSFALQEYIMYETMALSPDVEIMKKIVKAIFASWKDQGGDPNRGQILPALLEERGFTVKYLEPLARIARPTDPLWAWPDSFYKNYLPKLVLSGYLSASEVEEFFATWNDIKNRPGHFFMAPTMLNIVAVKR